MAYGDDLIAAYEGGRARREYGEQKAKTKRFGELAGSLAGIKDAQMRAPIIKQMSELDAPQALQFDKYYQGQDAQAAEQAKLAEQQKLRLSLNKMQVIRTAAPGKKLELYKRIAPEDYALMVAQGIQPTDEQIDMTIDQYLPEVYARLGEAMPKAEQESFTGQPVPMMINGQPSMGRMGSRGTVQQAQGVSPYQAPDRAPKAQFVPLTPAELAQAGLPPGSSAQRDVATGKIDVLSKRDTGGQLSQKDATTAKLKLNTVALARKQLEDIRSAFLGKKGADGNRAGGIKGSFSAGLGQGYLPTEGGKGFDAAVDQMRSTLTALTRVPGVGAMSDYETKLDQAKFPDRKNYESVTEQQINALEDQLALIENGYRGLLEGNASPASPPQGGIQFLGFE